MIHTYLEYPHSKNFCFHERMVTHNLLFVRWVTLKDKIH